LLIFIFLAFSRIFDVGFGSLHITGISYRVVLAMVLLSRGFKVALTSNIGKALLGFTICFALAVPFSIWKAGSMNLFLNSWLDFSFVAFLAVAGLVSNYEQWFKVFKSLTYALLTFTIISNVFGIQRDGRLFLEQGKFSNPNEMAQALLLGLPLWGAMMVLSKSPGGKVFASGVIMLILTTVLRTGSRGALIGFVAMLLLVFFRASIVGKLKIMLAGMLFLGIVMTTVPGRLIARYKTIAEDDADVAEMGSSMAESATSSARTRKLLLRRSLMFTIRHPLFGVGPGMFAVADDEYAKAIGLRKGTWQGTHNSYTQVSSELGIPALLFFSAAIAMALKGTYSIYRRTRGDPRLQDIGAAALALHYCLVIYAVTILFDYIAYSVMLPVLGGLAACLVRTASVEIDRIQATPLPVSMSPTMFHSYLATRPGRSEGDLARAGRHEPPTAPLA
jgi:O-antigen ligase